MRLTSQPAEFQRRLALKLARRDLLAASDRGEDAAVVALADRTPALVDPADLDVAWRVAGALGRTGAAARSLDLDRTILGATADGPARLATVRKAMAVLAPASLDALLSMERTGPDVPSPAEGKPAVPMPVVPMPAIPMPGPGDMAVSIPATPPGTDTAQARRAAVRAPAGRTVGRHGQARPIRPSHAPWLRPGLPARGADASVGQETGTRLGYSPTA